MRTILISNLDYRSKRWFSVGVRYVLVLVIVLVLIRVDSLNRVSIYVDIVVLPIVLPQPGVIQYPAPQCLPMHWVPFKVANESLYHETSSRSH